MNDHSVPFTRFPNGLLEAIFSAKFSMKEMAVLLFLVRETVGFGRHSANFSLNYVQRATGIKKQHASETITGLLAGGVITGTRPSGRSPGCYSVANPEAWKVPKRGTVPNSGRFLIKELNAPESGTIRSQIGNPTPSSLKKPKKETTKETITAAHPAALPGVKVLIDLFHQKLTQKMGERPASFNGGMAGKRFKLLLTPNPPYQPLSVEEITRRMDNWFNSTDPYIVQEGYRAELFFQKFSSLKGGPIHARQISSRPNGAIQPADPGQFAGIVRTA